MKKDIIDFNEYKKTNTANTIKPPQSEYIQIKTTEEHYNDIKTNILDVGNEIVCRDIGEFIAISNILMEHNPNIRYIECDNVFVNNVMLMRIKPRYRDSSSGLQYTHVNIVNDFEHEHGPIVFIDPDNN